MECNIMAYSGIPKGTINAQDYVPILTWAPQSNTTGAITATAQTITVTNLIGVGSVTVLISGTYAGVNLTFEGSPDGGTTWDVVNGQRASTGVSTASGATGVLTTNSTVIFNVSFLPGYDQFRVRSTAYTSGTANIVIHPSVQYAQNMVNVVSMPTTTVTGTVTANIGTGGTAATSLGKAEDAVHASGDTGVAFWAVRNDGTATSLTSATGDYSGVAVDATGTLWMRNSPGTPSAPVQVTAATTSTQLIAANASRKKLLLHNNSTSDCFVKYGTAASSTSYTFFFPSGAQTTIDNSETNGVVHAIWNSANGFMMVTEVV
jgi:hypothetical protein